MSNGAGKGSATRPTNRAKYTAGRARVFGKPGRRLPAGRYLLVDGKWVPIESVKHREKRADNVNFKSVAMGCAVKQIPAWTKKYGPLGIKFHPKTGDAIFPNRAAKLKMLKMRGMIDHDEVRSGRS